MKIYVAGPYSKGNKELNVEKAIFYGDWIAAFGHTVFIPHLTHYWDQQISHPWEFWMEQDLEWLRLCDGFFRISGESRGADLEEAEAMKYDLRIFHDIFEVSQCKDGV